MLGGRTIGAIIGIIAACSLFVLLAACCIVYYRRYLKRKESSQIQSHITYVNHSQQSEMRNYAHTYVTAAQADDERINEQVSTEQPRIENRTTNYITSDSPPPYSEAVKRLNDL